MITSHQAVGGLGLELIELEQVFKVVGLVIVLVLSPTSSAYLLIKSLELMQLEVGLSSLVLEVDYKPFESLVTKCW